YTHLVVLRLLFCFFFYATSTTDMYTLSLHDALPISLHSISVFCWVNGANTLIKPIGVSTQFLSESEQHRCQTLFPLKNDPLTPRSEEHTSELQSRFDLVCRLLLEKKNFRASGKNRPV